jgi:Type II CAAX prenyl endopeptidase Rce1-like
MQELLKDFCSFVIEPSIYLKSRFYELSIRTFFMLLGGILCFDIIVSDLKSHLILSAAQPIGYSMQADHIFTLILVVVIAPISEELVSRFPLKANGFLKYFFLYILFSKVLTLFGVTIAALVCGLTIFLSCFSYKIYDKNNTLVWISSLLFGAFHLPGIQNDPISVIINMFYFGTVGLFLSYIRCKYGIWNSFKMHATANLFFVSFSILIQELVSRPKYYSDYFEFVQSGFSFEFKPIFVFILIVGFLSTVMVYFYSLRFVIINCEFFGKADKKIKFVGVFALAMILLLLPKSQNITERKLLELNNYKQKLEKRI